MERRDLLKGAAMLATGAFIESKFGVLVPQEVNAAVEIPQGITLSDEAVNDHGKILNPRAGEPTSPKPLNPNIMVYRKYDDVLGGLRKDGDGRGLVENHYELNATSDNENFRRNFEGEPYAVLAFQGLEVDLPGFGYLRSNGGRESVLLTLINFDKTPLAWRQGRGATHPQMMQIAGFTQKAELVDGSRERDNLEERWVGHWLSTQFSNKYDGITGHVDGAQSVLYASFAREGGVHRLLRAGRFMRPAGV